MGTGMCSRRQKGLLQTGFCLVAVACLGSGVFMYGHLQQKAKGAEALALKYRQQQEALSAQLQDFLVYKLEAQEALNKEKQDSMNRYGALSSQHKILKNQHEDVKKQLLDLQLQQNSLKLEHRKTVETHSQKYAQLQREKESEVTGLQDTVFKLREESKLLRQAHQDVHSQLLDAQTQMEEFRQLKEALQKMPSFKEVGPVKGQQQLQALKEQPPVLGSNHLQFSRQKVFAANGAKMPLSPVDQEKPPGGSLMRPQISGVRSQGEGTLPQGQTSRNNDGPRPQGNVLFAHPAPLQEANPPPAWPQGHGDSPVIRFTRTVNSVQNGNSDHKVVVSIQGKTSEENHAPRRVVPHLKHPSTLEKEAAPANHPLAGNKQAQMQSWQDIVNKVNARMDEEQVHGYPKHLHFDTRSEQNGNLLLANQQRGAERAIANREGDKEGTDDEELEMDAGMIEREEDIHTRKEALVQEPMMPDDAADPAQDPNNQGEDEFEEAELERPDFEKVVQSDKYKEPSMLGKEETKKPLKDAAGLDKAREEPMDDYQEDQEQEIEDHGGEVDDNGDLELVQEQKDRGGIPGAESKKDDYY
ncbi:uncharacterized protein [Lepidochelys kempii]|uniref:uncharacterized protein isoform X2 n=1 Tax=Lepidochelys kempii TaxID=8472 RepID=UPI003C704B25